MLPLSTIVSFFGASILLAIAPGPDIIFVLTESLAHGKKAGIWVALGNVAGLIIPTIATAFGVGALISTSPVAYAALKYVGACYLLYLAFRALRSSGVNEIASHGEGEISTSNLFMRGAIVSTTNPHVHVLFLAFLPQFVDPAQGNAGLQVVSLGLIFMVAALLVFIGVALASGMVRERISKSPSTLKVIDRLTAVVFVGLALKLLLG